MVKVKGTRLARWGRFVGKMVPLVPSQISVFAVFAVNHWVLSRFFFYRQVPVAEVLLGGISLVAFAILLRAYDEVKDQKSDPVNFPDRPLVKGMVNVADLKALMWALNGVVIAANLPFLFGGPAWGAGLLLLFGLGMYVWFFAERWIRPRLTLAFLTHHPVVFFQQLYILSFFWFPGVSSSTGAHGVPPGAWVYLLATGLCFTQWEIGRKIRGSSEETAYVTYSKLYGSRAPTAAVLLLGLASLGLSFWSVGSAAWTPVVMVGWVLPATLWAHLLLRCLPFLRKPRKAPPIREGVERFTVALLVASPLAIVLSIWL